MRLLNEFLQSILPACLSCQIVASTPGPSQIFLTAVEKNQEKAWDQNYVTDRPEMVDSVSINRVHVTYWPSPRSSVRDVILIPGFLLIFLHGCKIKSGRGQGMRLVRLPYLLSVFSCSKLFSQTLFSQIKPNTILTNKAKHYSHK